MLGCCVMYIKISFVHYIVVSVETPLYRDADDYARVDEKMTG